MTAFPIINEHIVSTYRVAVIAVPSDAHGDDCDVCGLEGAQCVTNVYVTDDNGDGALAHTCGNFECVRYVAEDRNNVTDASDTLVEFSVAPVN